MSTPSDRVSDQTPGEVSGQRDIPPPHPDDLVIDEDLEVVRDADGEDAALCIDPDVIAGFSDWKDHTQPPPWEGFRQPSPWEGLSA